MVLLALSAGALLGGFGQGGLFARLDTQMGRTPNTQSAEVSSILAGKGHRENVLLVVQSVPIASNLNDLRKRTDNFESVLKQISTVKQVEQPLDGLAKERELQDLAKRTEDGLRTLQNLKKDLEDKQELLKQGQKSPEQQKRFEALPSGEQVRLLKEMREQEAKLAAGLAKVEQQLLSVKSEKRKLDEGLKELQDGIGILLAKDGKGFVISVELEAKSAEELSEAVTGVERAAKQFENGLKSLDSHAEVGILSAQIVGNEITELSKADLAQGEMVSMPVALILLVLVFGGLLAALLPLLGASAAIVLGLAGVWVLTFVMDVNSFVLNVITIIGLALSIDYGLLIVSRFREEVDHLCAKESLDANRLNASQSKKITEQALGVALGQAGRTVLFSALTIAFSIAGLFVFPTTVLRIIAFGGVVVTLAAVAASLTLVPALLSLFSNYLVKPPIVKRLFGRKAVSATLEAEFHGERGVFASLARLVQAKPVVWTVALTLLLATMALPLFGMHTRTNLMAYLSVDSPAGKVHQVVSEQYPKLADPPITILSEAKGEQLEQQLKTFEKRQEVDLVWKVPVFDNDRYTQINLSLKSALKDNPQLEQEALAELRHDYPDLLIGGPIAFQYDFTQSLKAGFPWALLIVVTAVFVLLFAMTGSILVPLKALILNGLSLAASLGLTAWLFSQGWFGLPQVDSLETFIVACSLAFGFGLSMDYEVFLVARIKEYWDSLGDNDAAVSQGLQRSGRIITSAAAIIVAVFVGFVTGQMLPIKQIGVALAIMVITDATVVRMLLVPATMTLLGKWNWWAPEPLVRLHQKIELKD
ncbi:MMPL family transporter [Boudabousia tangfeifanii]|uniref:MMPL family transporter n=1 Tax=Boudabousia tangfeifanii TaxID=1912795 RepID=UPI0014794DE4|nr:MMPL family transporter [Boudabousia tangfeifanii]